MTEERRRSGITLFDGSRRLRKFIEGMESTFAKLPDKDQAHAKEATAQFTEEEKTAA
jgi:hypothetical protein